MCFIRRLFIHSMLYSFAHLSISGHGSVVSETENWRSSRADAVFFGQAELTLTSPPKHLACKGLSLRGQNCWAGYFFGSKHLRHYLMKNKRFSKPCFLLLTSPVRRPEGECGGGQSMRGKWKWENHGIATIARKQSHQFRTNVRS